MSTVGALIERLYRTYLYPPDNRPAQTFLQTTITDVATTLVLTSFLIPEDQTLMTAGVIIEVAQELMQVTAYDDATLTATVNRGVLGTTAVAHTSGDVITLSPPFPRMSVMEALADNIITLYPKLYTVQTLSLSPTGGRIYALPDPLAVEVISCWPDAYFSDTEIDAEIVDHTAIVGGRSLITNLDAGEIWVRYRKRFGEVVDEDSTYLDLGLEDRWVNIVMVGAAGDLFAGRDLPASITDWVGKTAETEVVPVGSRSQLARQLAAYRTYLLDQAAAEMRAEYKAKMHMRGNFKVVSRSPFG